MHYKITMDIGMFIMLFREIVDEPTEEPFGVLIIEYFGTCLFLYDSDNILYIQR
jgi:hypothetical protein